MVILKHTTHSFPNLPQYTTTLPKNYNLELPKTLSTILKHQSKNVALQLPDGLLKYSLVLSDIITHFTGARVTILGDVVYGACCIDDRAAAKLGCDLVVHYGHSCLVPIQVMKVRCLYVFVDIFFDVGHCVEMIKKIVREDKDVIEDTINDGIEDVNENVINNVIDSICNNNVIDGICNNNVSDDSLLDDVIDDCLLDDVHTDKLIEIENSSNIVKTDIMITEKVYNFDKIAILGTIQFNTAINTISKLLNITKPQVRPLSKGEVLGCTSPKLTNCTTVIYIADGRFHLESVMIQNPNLKFYKYCPFTKKMSREYYNFERMIKDRRDSRIKAFSGRSFGVILGTLGRQGNPRILDNVVEYLENRGYIVYKIVLKEIKQSTLDDYDFVDAFVQVSCPRLSIDWGVNYRKPLLNPYEVFNELDTYSMDYYSKEKDEKWNNYFTK